MNKERTILYLFSINAIIYIASGFYTPFLSAYYAQKGIDAEKIGILLMIGPCVVLLTQRFWARTTVPNDNSCARFAMPGSHLMKADFPL